MVACGKQHTSFITDKGVIYNMGSNFKGQLGTGDNTLDKLASPVMVESLSMWQAKKICCA